MKHIIDDAWQENIERAATNDWSIIPIVMIATLVIFGAYAGVENVFNVLAQFIGGVISN